jgi:hypothetical protein
MTSTTAATNASSSFAHRHHQVSVNIFSVTHPHVSRYFRGVAADGSKYDGWFDGTVTNFAHGYYRVNYEDGDEEDLRLSEVLEAVSCYYCPEIKREKEQKFKRIIERARAAPVRNEEPRAKKSRTNESQSTMDIIVLDGDSVEDVNEAQVQNDSVVDESMAETQDTIKAILEDLDGPPEDKELNERDMNVNSKLETEIISMDIDDAAKTSEPLAIPDASMDLADNQEEAQTVASPAVLDGKNDAQKTATTNNSVTRMKTADADAVKESNDQQGVPTVASPAPEKENGDNTEETTRNDDTDKEAFEAAAATDAAAMVSQELTSDVAVSSVVETAVDADDVKESTDLQGAQPVASPAPEKENGDNMKETTKNDDTDKEAAEAAAANADAAVMVSQESTSDDAAPPFIVDTTTEEGWIRFRTEVKTRDLPRKMQEILHLMDDLFPGRSFHAKLWADDARTKMKTFKQLRKLEEQGRPALAWHEKNQEWAPSTKHDMEAFMCVLMELASSE